MSDLISRQAAIDEFEKELSAKYNRREFAIGFVGIKRILEKLPSAQPEIIRCKDCKWFVPDGDGWGTCVEDASKWEEDGFCSWGELEGEEE